MEHHRDRRHPGKARHRGDPRLSAGELPGAFRRLSGELLPYPLFKKKHFCMFHGNQLGKLKIIQNTIGKLMGRHLLVMAPSLKRRFPKASINYCGVSLEKFKDMKKKRKYLGWISKGTEILKKEELEILSKKLDLPLLVASGLKHEEMNDKFYSLCKVFISMPPASAGFQASWLESMTAGVPIVIGNDNGAGEVQPFPKVPQEKEHDLNFIANLIKSQKGTNYVSWVKQNNFTWKRHSENLIKIFNKI